MRIQQLSDIISKLDSTKRIKFANVSAWNTESISIDCIIEEGNVYIFKHGIHPHCIKEDLKEGQELIWFNPNCNSYKEIKKYFPNYKEL